MFQDSAMTPQDIKNNDAAMAYFEGRSLGLVKRSAAPILESLLGKLQNKPLLGKIIAKVKKVVGKLKKKNKDKSKRFKRAPFSTWKRPNPKKVDCSCRKLFALRLANYVQWLNSSCTNTIICFIQGM